MGYQFFPSLITMFLLDFLQINLAWKVTFSVLVVTDIKTFPLVWHVSLPRLNFSLHTILTSSPTRKLRLLNALRFVLPSQRAEPGPTPDCIFKPLVTSSHCSLSELDFNWHSKTNYPHFFTDDSTLPNAYSKTRVQQYLLFRPGHCSNALVVHTLLHWHRPSATQERERVSKPPKGQLHDQIRGSQVFLQTRDQTLPAVRDVDAGAIVGNQMAVHHYALRPQ